MWNPINIAIHQNHNSTKIRSCPPQNQYQDPFSHILNYGRCEIFNPSLKSGLALCYQPTKVVRHAPPGLTYSGTPELLPHYTKGARVPKVLLEDFTDMALKTTNNN